MNALILTLVAAVSLFCAGAAGAEPEKRNTVIHKKPVEVVQVDTESKQQTKVAQAEPKSPPKPTPNGPRTRRPE